MIRGDNQYSLTLKIRIRPPSNETGSGAGETRHSVRRPFIGSRIITRVGFGVVDGAADVARNEWSYREAAVFTNKRL